MLDPSPGDLGDAFDAFDAAHSRLDAAAVRRLVGADAFDDGEVGAIFCGEVSPCGARRLDRIDGVDHDGMPEPQMLLGQGLRDVFSIGFVLPLRIGDVVDHALRAAFSEGFDSFGADATGTPSDEHNFAGEIEWIRHAPILAGYYCPQSDCR